MPCSPALRTEDFGLLKQSWQYIEDAGALPDIFATLPEGNTILEGPVQEEYEEVLQVIIVVQGKALVQTWSVHTLCFAGLGRLRV